MSIIRKNYEQVHKIDRMIEPKKIRVLTVKNPSNLGAYSIIEILLILRSTHIVPKD